MSDDESPIGGHQQPSPEYDADNSIIEKVRTRVSSILPQSISKWFSPTTSSSTSLTSGNDGKPANVPSNNGSIRRRRNDLEPRQIVDHQNDVGDYLDDSEDEVTRAPQTKRVRLNNVEKQHPEVNKIQIQSGRKVTSTPTTSNRRKYMNMPTNELRPAPYDFTTSLSSPLFTSTLVGSRIGQSEVRALQDETDETGEVDVLEVIPEYISGSSTSSRRRLNIPSTSDRPYSSASHRRGFSSTGDFDLPNLKRPSLSPNRLTTLAEIEGERNDNNERNVRDEVIVSRKNNNDQNKIDLEKNTLSNGIQSSRNMHTTDTASESGESHCSSLNTNKMYDFAQSSKRFRSSVGSGLNFATHLQGEKSLFSDKNMPKALNNSTTSLTSLYRRQSFNPSLYGSTSALSDSRLLNTSSPFYKGRTTYGGASAYSKYTPIRNIELKRTDSSSPGLSNAAKRVLHILNAFSSPLEDARKMANNSSKAGQMKRLGDLQQTIIHNSLRNRMNKTPYARPTSSNAGNCSSPPTEELNVPSKIKLLQMKKLQTNTEKVRDIAIAPRAETSSGRGEAASSSKSNVNVSEEYKLPVESTQISGRKSIRAVKKIKSKATTRNTRTEIDEGDTVQPVNLPEITFPTMKSVPKIDLVSSTPKTSTTSKARRIEQTTPVITVTSTEETEEKLRQTKSNNPSGKTDVQNSSTKSTSFILPTSDPKLISATNEQNKMTPFGTSMFGNTSFVKPTNPSAAKTDSITSVKSDTEFKFSSPILLNSENVGVTKSNDSNTISLEFKFSNPLPVNKSAVLPEINFKAGSSEKSVSKIKEIANNLTTKADTLPSGFNVPVPQLKTTGSVLDVLKKSPSASCTESNKLASSECNKPKESKEPNQELKLNAPASSVAVDFKQIASQQASKWECTSCLARNEPSKDKCACCEAPKPGVSIAQGAATLPSTKPCDIDDGFKKIAAAQKSSKWNCSSCLTMNEESQNKCVCCEQAKPGAVLDAGFKNLVAQQSSKWECTACMTRNESTRNSCVCCEQAKPGSSKPDVPSFSFGGKSSKFTFGFGAQGEPQLKSDTSVEKKSDSEVKTTSTLLPQSQQLPSVQTAAKPATFTFGIKPIVPAVKDTTDGTTAKNVTTAPAATTSSAASVSKPNPTFSFGIKPSAASTEPEKKEDNSSASFSFGVKPAPADNKEDDKSKSSTIGSFKFTSPSVAAPPTEPAKPTTETKPSTEKSSVFQRLGGFQSDKEKGTEKSLFGFTSPSTMSSTNPTTQKSEVSTTSNSDAIKKMFQFGASPSASADTNKSEKDKSFGFGFAKTPTTGSPLSSTGFGSPSFGAKIYTPQPATTSTTSTSAPTSNLFVFGKPATSTSVTPSFGAISSNTITSTNQPTAATTTSSFGNLGSSVTSTSTSTFAVDKPTPTPTNIPTFGSTPTTQQQQQQQQQSNLWSFGASNNNQQSQEQKSTFTFGGLANKTESTPTFGSVSSTTSKPFTFGSNLSNATTTTTANSSFGGFGGSVANATPTFGSGAGSSSTPTFGSPAATANNNNTQQSTQQSPFGQPLGFVNPFVSSTNPPAFGSPQPPAANPIFGSTPTPSQSFGNTPTFGASAAPAPTFGSAAASSSTFGTTRPTPFGSSDEPAAKKSAPAFNFGSSAAQPQQTGFAFGANNNNNTKTAFNFTPTATPNFNFTNKQETPSSQPFQFGAPTGPPTVFKFSGIEATSGNFFKQPTSSTETKTGSTSHTAVGVQLKRWLKPSKITRNSTVSTESDIMNTSGILTTNESKSLTMSKLTKTEPEDYTESKQFDQMQDVPSAKLYEIGESQFDNQIKPETEIINYKKPNSNFLILRSNKKIYRLTNTTNRKSKQHKSMQSTDDTSSIAATCTNDVDSLNSAASFGISSTMAAQRKSYLKNFSKPNRYKLIRMHAAPSSTSSTVRNLTQTNSKESSPISKNNNNDNDINDNVSNDSNQLQKTYVTRHSINKIKEDNTNDGINKRKQRSLVNATPSFAKTIKLSSASATTTRINKYATKVKKKYVQSKYKYVRQSD